MPGNAASDRKQAKWHWDRSPRWIRYSGLPQALGAATWAVLLSLMLAEERTRNLRARKRAAKPARFRVSQAELVRTTGLPLRNVKRAVRKLVGSGLLSFYERGRGHRGKPETRWSCFELNLETLRQLYLYVGPLMAVAHDGISGKTRTQLPEAGMLIYGDRKTGAVVTWPELSTVRREGKAPEDPDVERVREICGLNTEEVD